MKCKKCDFELVQGQDICPRCGVSQSIIQNDTQGVAMELPTMATATTPIEERKAKSFVKEVADKAKKGAKMTVDKAKNAPKGSADNIDEASQEAGDTAKKSSSKTWRNALIGVAGAIVVIIVAFLIISYNPQKGVSEQQFVNLASTEDEVYLIEGDKLTKVAKIPEGLNASEILTAINSNSFYIVSDAEYSDEIGEFTGDLLYLKSNGKEEEIDNDVIVGSQVIIGNLIWYERADKDQMIVCCYDGRKITEVIDEGNLSSWFGTDKVGKAYYSLIDEDDYTTEVFLVDKGDSDSIMDEADVVAISKDYKKAILASQEDNNTTVYIYDGKDDFEVMDDVLDVLLNVETFDMILVADNDDRVLYHIPYSKEEIEIDDEVEEILMMPNLRSTYFVEDFGSMIYYGKDDDLYAADFKGKDSERVLKNYNDLNIISQPIGTKEIVYVDDDEIVWINIKTFKETSVELPDANELNSYDIAVVGKYYVYRTEDNKELFASNGRDKEAIELSSDAEEIISFQAFMDEYVLWMNIDGELVISGMKEDSVEEIGDEVSDFWITDDGQIYFLSDFEDGEGDLYYISRVGKEAERIEKGITNLFRLFYD